MRALKRGGFTLVEMMAGVAIVAVLAALGLSAMKAATRNSQRTQCASNLRQAGLALLGYCQDHDGWLPGSASGSVGPQMLGNLGTGELGSVAKDLAPYVSDSIWFDPDPLNIAFSHSTGTQFGKVWKKVSPTGVPNGQEVLQGAWGVGTYKLTQYAQPAATGVINCQDDTLVAGDPDMHGGQYNRLYLDGHIDIISKPK